MKKILIAPVLILLSSCNNESADSKIKKEINAKEQHLKESYELRKSTKDFIMALHDSTDTKAKFRFDSLKLYKELENIDYDLNKTFTEIDSLRGELFKQKK